MSKMAKVVVERIGQPLAQQSSKFHGQCAEAHKLNGFSLKWLLSLIAVFVIAASAYNASAQVVTADIVGTVTDPNGAVIPGAAVTVVNTETHLQRSMSSTSTGDYVFT